MALKRAALEQREQSTDFRRREHEFEMSEAERQREQEEEAREAAKKVYREQFPDMSEEDIEAHVAAGIDPLSIQKSKQDLRKGEADIGASEARTTGTRQDNAARSRELQDDARTRELLQDDEFLEAFGPELAGEPITQETIQTLRGARQPNQDPLSRTVEPPRDWTIADVRNAREMAGATEGRSSSGRVRRQEALEESASQVANHLVDEAGGNVQAALEEWPSMAQQLMASGDITLEEADAVHEKLKGFVESTSEGGGESGDAVADMRREIDARLEADSASQGG
jgi:hypothetical protein